MPENMDALYKKGQSRLHLLRRMRSFGVQKTLFGTFNDTVVDQWQHRQGQDET